MTLKYSKKTGKAIKPRKPQAPKMPQERRLTSYEVYEGTTVAALLTTLKTWQAQPEDARFQLDAETYYDGTSLEVYMHFEGIDPDYKALMIDYEMKQAKYLADLAEYAADMIEYQDTDAAKAKRKQLIAQAEHQLATANRIAAKEAAKLEALLKAVQ